MIAKRIPKKADVTDNFVRLGRYVAAAKEKGEKLDRFWIVNCNAGTGLEDLDSALIEIEALRAMKPDKDDMTYHLVVSFHPGEEERLSGEALADIERSFSEALGYGAHQRVVGTHINTDNFHMHIAINKLHPDKMVCHSPYNDFKTLERVAREMERKYGLAVDRGMSDRDAPGRSQKARHYEAQTWQQSFESYLLKHKDEILKIISGATTWQSLHEGLAEQGVVLVKRGNGLAFRPSDETQATGKQAMKASGLDRSCSLKALETRLGPFEAAKAEHKGKGTARSAYRPSPLTRHPATPQLWNRYQQRGPSFWSRHFHIRNWKSYLLADAHKDALAMAVLISYREWAQALFGPSRSRSVPRSLRPALKTWIESSTWVERKTTPWLRGQGSRFPGLGLKIDNEGRVLIPLRDSDGHIRVCRLLDAEGRSTDIGNPASSPGLHHVIGPLTPESKTVVLATDPEAAAALHTATGVPVVLAARTDDLPDVARLVRHRAPVAELIIATEQPEPLAEQAARRVKGQVETVQSLLDRSRDILLANADPALAGLAVSLIEAMGGEAKDWDGETALVKRWLTQDGHSALELQMAALRLGDRRAGQKPLEKPLAYLGKALPVLIEQVAVRPRPKPQEPEKSPVASPEPDLPKR